MYFLMNEVWKDIPGYEGFYSVSNLGRVKSFVKCKQGRLLKPGCSNGFGHRTVALGRNKSRYVHRLVLLAFVGPCPRNNEVLHTNGKGRDNRLCNLRYGTRAENNRDMVFHGKRRFSPAEVNNIRKSAKPLKYFAEKFDVSLTTVSKIKNRKSYTHV